jgi:hypothetical protein
MDTNTNVGTNVGTGTNVDTGTNVGTNVGTYENNAVINQITLACLINKEQYDKYLSSTQQIQKIQNKKDRKFYRKRILQLSKDILLNAAPPTTSKDVHVAFNNYVNTCVQYFKMVDRTDFIQNEYTDSDDGIEENDTIERDDHIKIPEAVNNLMLRSVKVDHFTMDKFVKRTIVKKDSPIPLPTQKNIDLADPALRNKGIRKKKNINTNYEETVDQKKTPVSNE